MFLEPEITGLESWAEVISDYGYGIIYVPIDELGIVLTGNSERDKELLREYIGNDSVSIMQVEGYGARFSAPGYLDCTEWCVFDTIEEAEEYLQDNDDIYEEGEE